MKTEKQTTMLCRTMFCQTCFDNKMPQKGGLFLTIGRGRQKYTVRKVIENGRFGFTPHVIEKIETKNNKVTFAATCSMHGCQSHIVENEDETTYSIVLLTATVHTLQIREWNALVKYTNDSDYWLG